MKKAPMYGVIVILVALGAYFIFIRSGGGLKLQETVKTGNSISTSSTAKTPTVGMVLEKNGVKLTVTAVSENEVTFTTGVNNNCVPGENTEIITLKKGDKKVYSSCSDTNKTYTVSY